MKPTTIGIGAQKCASSWIHSVLGAHPDVSVSDPKELDFFSYYFDRGYGWYEKHFDDHGASPVRFESSPSYFYDPRSAERAKTYNPDFRVVVLLRDPVARAFSNHMHEIIKRHIPVCSFEEGLANNPVYVDQGRYGTHLKRWIDAFGRDRVLVMLAEEIKADPHLAAAQLYEFVGADAEFKSAIATEARNVSDEARWPVMRNILRRGGDQMRQMGMEELLSKAKSTGPVARLLDHNSVDIRGEIPPMLEKTRTMLIEQFIPEMQMLSQLLQKDDFPWPTWQATRVDA